MSKNTYIIPVIETNGENHEKRTDECKQHFTIIWVYKSQTNKYILLVKTKQLNSKEYFMFGRTVNLETRAIYLNAILNTNKIDEMSLKNFFSGCDEKEDRFPIVLNGVKLSMTYKEVQNYNRKNKTKFKLRYTKKGHGIKNRNFNEMLKLHNSGDLSLNKICELMKEADTCREFV